MAGGGSRCRRAGRGSASSAIPTVQAINRAGSWASSRSSPGARSSTPPRSPRIDGVDVLFVGPTDLSHSLGIPGSFDDPAYLDALRHVGDVRRGGREESPGSCCATRSSLPRHRELGFRFIGLGSDFAFTTDAARAVLSATRT